MQKYKFLIYLITGGLNTLISLGLYVLLLYLGVNYLVASSITYIYGIIEGYFFSATFVFRNKIKIVGLYKYTGVYGVTFFINIALMYTAVGICGLHKLLAQIVAIVIVTILNFQLIKIFVFE